MTNAMYINHVGWVEQDSPRQVQLFGGCFKCAEWALYDAAMSALQTSKDFSTIIADAVMIEIRVRRS
jgi:hypothetical protein